MGSVDGIDKVLASKDAEIARLEAYGADLGPTVADDLIAILGDAHDEEECDDMADLVEEVRVYVARLRVALEKIAAPGCRVYAGSDTCLTLAHLPQCAPCFARRAIDGEKEGNDASH